MPPGLAARVERLEKDVAEIKGDVKTLTAITARIDGRVSVLPTTFQITTWFVGVAIGLVGLVFAIARLAR
ncbi:MAG: hypothetical protein KF889_24050 [Alphaproteobacteria bacterium]|nr:hypothetical protein [Alphaproteobacteria bacterium]MCW5742531.1 hypothetical protein [Alphaproteobacteria bacterium]